MSLKCLWHLSPFMLKWIQQNNIIFGNIPSILILFCNCLQYTIEYVHQDKCDEILHFKTRFLIIPAQETPHDHKTVILIPPLHYYPSPLCAFPIWFSLSAPTTKFQTTIYSKYRIFVQFVFTKCLLTRLF